MEERPESSEARDPVDDDLVAEPLRTFDFGDVLVFAALVVVGAVIAWALANVIRTWVLLDQSQPDGPPTLDRIQTVIESTVGVYLSALLLGAALMLMAAAVFSDASSRWLDRALGVTGAAAALYGVAAAFAALEIPSWNGSADDIGFSVDGPDPTTLHVSHALSTVAVAVVAAGAVVVCWLTVSGRVVDRLGDDDEEVAVA